MPAPWQNPIRPGNPDASLFLSPHAGADGTRPGDGHDTSAPGGCPDTADPPRADPAPELRPHKPASNSADPDHTTSTGTPPDDKARIPGGGNRGGGGAPWLLSLDICPKTRDTLPGRGETPGAGRGTNRSPKNLARPPLFSSEIFAPIPAKPRAGQQPPQRPTTSRALARDDDFGQGRGNAPISPDCSGSRPPMTPASWAGSSGRDSGYPLVPQPSCLQSFKNLKFFPRRHLWGTAESGTPRMS